MVDGQVQNNFHVSFLLRMADMVLLNINYNILPNACYTGGINITAVMFIIAVNNNRVKPNFFKLLRVYCCTIKKITNKYFHLMFSRSVYLIFFFF